MRGFAIGIIATTLALGACTTSPFGVDRSTAAGGTSAPATTGKGPTKAKPPAGYPALSGFPDRLSGTFTGHCQQREVDGFQENATLRVVKRQVQALDWQSIVGKRGSCRFGLVDFRQTKSQPNLELLALDGSGCKLLVYQDARRVTLAHAGCERRCTPTSIADEAWPVMFDPASGRCARLER